MNKITTFIKRIPKKASLLVLILAAAIIIPANLFAWGPDRPTYTIEHPADHVTFDSITNNPDYGDERNFVTIKDASVPGLSSWSDELQVQNGKEYLVRMYVHNNAASNLNLVAKDVTARFNVPTYSANRIQIDGYLSSSNATPSSVWDQAVFTDTNDFKIEYVPGSASYTNNVFTAGTPIADTVTSTGSLLGYSSMNGNIPGCFQYAGYLVFKVKAIEPSFDVQKTVRINGIDDKTFKETVNVQPGSKVDFQIYFNNNGGTQLTNVYASDVLPSGMTYVDGSALLYDSLGKHTLPDVLTTSGVNIGGYIPGGDAYVRFTAKIADNKDLTICGVNTLTNIGKITTSIGTKQDTATVTVTKTCQPNECKPGIPVGDSRCETPKECKPGIPVGDKRCAPTELPHTGPAEDVMNLIGIGTLVASIGYYRSSRRELLNRR